MKMIHMTVILAVLAALAPAGHGANWYIAPTGNDTTGTGAASQPWLTIAKALAVAADGDTVLMGAGDYVFPGSPARNRTSNYVTLRPQPGAAGQVRINGYIRPNSNHNYLRFMNLNLTGGIHFDNVTGFQVLGCVVAGNASLYGIKGNGTDVLIEGNDVQAAAKGIVVYGSNVMVRYNDVHHCFSDGFFAGNTTNLTIEGNYFHDNQPTVGAHPDHFQFYGGNPGALNGVTIRGNYFDTAGQGLFAERYNGTIENVLVENNVLITTLLRAWSFETTNKVVCRNNTFWFPPEQGLADPTGGYALIYMPAWAGGSYVYANNTSRGLGKPASGFLTVCNNLYFEERATDPGSLGPISPLVMFADFDAHNFTIKAGSPTIDAGSARHASATDILGRPRDASPDIGALEYRATDSRPLVDVFVELLRARQAAIRVTGDVNDSGTVTLGDLAAIRARVGQPVTAATARYDLNGDGAIDVGDVLAARAQVGLRFP